MNFILICYTFIGDLMKKIYILLTLIFILVGCTPKNTADNNKVSNAPQKIKTELKNENSPTYHAKIWATGDIMYHLPLYINNFDETTGKYTFNFYQKVNEYLNGADLVLGNFETTVNPSKKLSGHPMFNTPPEALTYLKSAGFDALSTSNNHCLDSGYSGIQTTLDAIELSGLKHFGTIRNADSPLIISVRGIAIGLLSYSEMFNGLDMAVDAQNRINLSPLNEDLILGDISNLKSMGADYIIAYPHWGVEYASEPSQTQTYFEKFLLENGVDAVLGSHPHVLQRAELKSGKFTIYSMGNSISNQRQQWLKHQGVESSVFVELNLTKKDNVTVLENFILHPTYVNRYRDENGKFQSEVMLYSDILEGGKYRNNLDTNTQQFIDNEYEWVKNRLGILRSE